MKVHELRPPAGAHRPGRRVGRGTGGKGGKTAGRGTKGQGARDTVKPGFEGGQLPLAQRIPKLKGFRNPFRVSYSVVNLDTLEAFAGDVVSPTSLQAAGLVPKRALVKVLGRGELHRTLRVEVHAVSDAARRAIEGAGGQVELLALPFGHGRPPARGNALTNR
ncbi:MAG TPA: 50S ribosomal protein L15 [Acidimicrobiales bacterium]|nr:50S ribosomal protein L15 [Acidimicrobiales bacterium]